MKKIVGKDQMEFLFTEGIPQTEKTSKAPVSSPSPPPKAKEAPPASVKEDKQRIQEKAKALHTELMKLSGLKFHLAITDNTSSILSSRGWNTAQPRVNMHKMFLHAPPEVHRALAKWIKKPKDKKAGIIINSFMAESRHLIRKKEKRRVRLVSKGKIHDLRELFDEVNEECFDGTIDAPIGWGKMPAKMPRRSIRFGSYDSLAKLIRIHPLLDQEYVPRYYVKFVVFHEMLHADMGISENENGRRSMHPPEFRRREKAYSEYEHATAWEKNTENMNRIFRSRKPKP